MNAIGGLSRVLAGLGVLVAAAAFGLAGAWVEVALLLALGVVWLAGQQRGWRWAGDAGLAGVTAAAAWGAWAELPIAWLLCAEVVALGAWDMERFERLLARSGSVTNANALWRGHALRLASVLAAGLLLALLALGVRVTLSFAWVIGLGSLALFGLSRAIGLLRRESN
jgi:hypothetical protein